MICNSCVIPDIKIIELKAYKDPRGYFLESYSARSLQAAHHISEHFVQDNFSHSKKNVLRGLHYQIDHPQGKLIRVIRGVVFDVVVDLRKSSTTFGCWMGLTLSAEDFQAVWIPPGFAHGFFVLSSEADFFYKTTDFYCAEAERCLLWNDPSLGIQWPLGAIEKPPVISEKDGQGKLFSQLEHFP